MTKTETERYFVYMVRCADGTLYCGMTNDVQKRVARHNNGRGAKYTRSRLPVVLVYSWEYPTYLMAAREEIRIKKLRRAEKEAMLGANRQ